MLGLEGKVAIITGSSGGIGRAIALKLASEGTKVVINGRTPASGEEVVRQIEDSGGEAAFVQGDVMDPAQMRNLVDRGVERFGQVDIMIASAGGGMRHREGASSGMYFPQIDAVALSENAGDYILARINPVRAVLDHMISRNTGSVMWLMSEGGRFPTPGQSIMALAGGGLAMFTKTLAKELGRYQIRANSISVTLVEDTHSWEMFGAAGTSDNEVVRRRFDKIRERAPFGIAKPAEIAEVAAFLASDSSRMITGLTVSPTGGLTLH